MKPTINSIWSAGVCCRFPLASGPGNALLRASWHACKAAASRRTPEVLRSRLAAGRSAMLLLPSLVELALGVRYTASGLVGATQVIVCLAKTRGNLDSTF
jgi:hypothetical protein